MFNSYWLIFLLTAAPLIGLALMIGLIILLIYNSDLFAKSLGSQLARKRKMRKSKTAKIVEYLIAISLWAIAINFLVARPGGLFGNARQLVDNSTKLDTSHFTNEPPPNQIIQGASQVSSLFQTNWFYLAFFGLLVVASVIVARGVIASWQETRSDFWNQSLAVRAEAISTVEDAFRILTSLPDIDPRSRIINCYQRMIQSAQRLGASVSSDQTARELEVAIRNMLSIHGSAMGELTDLFEEARYSLHPITETDAEKAQQCLKSIARDMNITLSA